MKLLTKILALAMVAVLCVGMFASCSPADNAADAAAALKDAGYKVVSDDRTYVIATLDGETDADDESIAIYYFTTKEEAEAKYEELKAESEEAIQAAEDALAALGDYVGDKIIEAAEAELEQLKSVKLGQSGTVVWAGTSAAIRAAR